MIYKLQIVTDQVQGDIDLLNAENTVELTHDTLDYQYGSAVVDSSLDPVVLNRNGTDVKPLTTYSIKGFGQVLFYSGRGFSEAQWESQYLGTYEDILTPDTFTTPADCNVIRMYGVVAEGTAIERADFYLVEGNVPAPHFGDTNIWSQLDLGDDEPAMTFQANDMAELKDRQADYSQELKLPLTAHNLTVLGLPDHVDSQTDFPYKTVECRLYADEYELAGKGAVLVIDGVTDAIECQVLGSSANLFDQLEDAPMSDLTEPSFTRDYGGDLLPANFPAGLEFVAASFTKGGFHHLLEMNPVYMLPVVNDLYLLGKILEAQGYTWVHNLAGYVGTEKNALPVVTLDPDEDSLLPFDGKGESDIQIINFPRYYLPTIVNGASGWLTSVGSNGSYSESYTVYTAKEDCGVRMQYTRTRIDGSGSVEVPFDTSIVCAGKDVLASSMAFVVAHDERISLAKGDTIVLTVIGRIQYEPVNVELLYKYHHVFSLTEMEADSIPLYGKVHAPRNLGFDTQFDYFKAFVQRYGLTVRVDHATSTVYTYTMKQVYDNKAFARDWSDKLVERGGEMSFRADGYARSNDIAFKDNGEDNVTDKGTFAVADTTLDKEKTLFDLPFEAGLDWGTTTKYASIPVFDVPDLSDEITTDTQRLEASEYSGGKPHLVRVSSDTVSMGDTSLDFYDYHRITHVTAQSLIDTYYAELTDSMLVKAKHRTDRFYLTPADIEDFDPFVPVYIRQYGAYFYVNKISNFIVGRLTSVELIKL